MKLTRLFFVRYLIKSFFSAPNLVSGSPTAEAKVFLAVGLPLTRFGAEKNDFIKYLTKNKRVSFKYENESYHIEIDDVAVFPQCYAAVVDKIPTMAKKTLIVDICDTLCHQPV